MRDPNRIDRIIGLLRAYWHQHPDLRLAQIVSNLAPAAYGNDIFYFKDDELEEELRRA